jgi:teichoic acid transport system permease protein
VEDGVPDGAARPATGHLTVGAAKALGTVGDMSHASGADRAATADSRAMSAAELAAEHGLAPSSIRPPLPQYMKQLWGRRHFIGAFATARTSAMFSNARLGQVWQVLTPLLNAAVYYLLFGLLLKTDRGVSNYTAFLIAGIFIFTYTQRSVLAASRSLLDNLGIIRALHFPRASLPFASTVVELQQVVVSVVVLCTIVLLTGEPLTLRWVLIVPALLLQTIFNIGISLIVARVGATVTDFSQLLPFLLRTWLYLSGVFYSIEHFTKGAPEAVRVLMMANPVAIYIELVRDAVMSEHTAPPHAWALGLLWAVAAFLVGFIFFWRAEETYGRG